MVSLRAIFAPNGTYLEKISFANSHFHAPFPAGVQLIPELSHDRDHDLVRLSALQTGKERGGAHEWTDKMAFKAVFFVGIGLGN